MGHYRTALQKQQHRAEIVRLLGEDRRQSEIAQELGISPQLVSKELKAIQDDWRFSTTGDFIDQKAREVARLNHMEGQLWEAWHKSTKGKKRNQQWAQPGEAAHAESDAESTVVRMSVTTENQPGNPRFMAAILKIVDQRCKLLDLYKPVKPWMKPVGGPDPSSPDVTKMTVKERADRAYEILMNHKRRMESEEARRNAGENEAPPEVPPFLP